MPNPIRFLALEFLAFQWFPTGQELEAQRRPHSVVGHTGDVSHKLKEENHQVSCRRKSLDCTYVHCLRSLTSMVLELFMWRNRRRKGSANVVVPAK